MSKLDPNEMARETPFAMMMQTNVHAGQRYELLCVVRAFGYFSHMHLPGITQEIIRLLPCQWDTIFDNIECLVSSEDLPCTLDTFIITLEVPVIISNILMRGFVCNL